MQKLSSKDRLLRTITGEPVDRIPIWPPIHWHPFMPEPEPKNWKAQSNFQQIVPLVEQYCDFLVAVDISVGNPPGQAVQDARGLGGGGYFDRRFFLAPTDNIDTSIEHTPQGGKVVSYILHTPQGDLRSKERVDPGVDTVWTIEPLIKSVEDAAKVLSIPYRFEKPDLEAYMTEAQNIGERGLPVCFVSTPMVMISHLMEFEMFFEWIATKRSLIDRMLNTIYERVAERLHYVLDHGIGPIFRFGGSEQATPPMMSKRMFDQFILGYEGRLWKLVRKAGQIVWVHCHGKVKTVIDDFVQGDVQLLDPVEPSPQGDIDIGEAKQRAAVGPLTLIGNIEFSDVCQLSADEIEALVKSAISQGGRQHFILGASDFPISAIDDRTRENLIRFIEAGVKYGTNVSGF